MGASSGIRAFWLYVSLVMIDMQMGKYANFE